MHVHLVYVTQYRREVFTKELTYEASVEPNEMHIYAAHYVSGMAKALIEDIAHGMLVSPDGAGNAPTPAPGA